MKALITGSRQARRWGRGYERRWGGISRAFRISRLRGFEVRKNYLTSGDSSVTIVIEGKGVFYGA